MSDLISRAAAFDSVEIFLKQTDAPEVYPGLIPALERVINNMPSAQPERKKGKWIPQDHNKITDMASTLVFYYPKCSECGHSGNYTNFCPRCGADMREETK